MKLKAEWDVYTYDVWGNPTDGYEVNDRYCHERCHETEMDVETYNAGQPGEFHGASLTDRQIRAIFGVNCQIDTDGDDLTVYVTRRRDGYPIGELHCTSHESLSPIRPVGPIAVKSSTDTAAPTDADTAVAPVTPESSANKS